MRGKSIVTLCSLAMVLSLTACGGNGSSGGNGVDGSMPNQSAGQSVGQNGTQNGAQNGTQNGVQNGAQSGAQNGAQSGTQNGTQGGAQNGSQSAGQGSGAGSSQRRLSNQGNRADDYMRDGRYTAYSDGDVDPGTNALGRDVANGARNFMNGVNQTARDVGDSVKNGVRDTTSGTTK